MYKNITPKLFASIFIISLLLVAGSYCLEYFMGVVPCLLCWFQRWTVILICIIAFAALLFSRNKLLAFFFNTVILLLTALGIFFAARQTWLQHQASPQSYSCLPNSSILLKTLPLKRIMQLAYTGTSDCGIVHMRPLGLSLAEWALIAFIILLILTFITYKKIVK